MSISRAIVSGIRTMMDDLLLSKEWFDKMDVSVLYGQNSIFEGKIIRVELKKERHLGLRTIWHVHEISNDNLVYVKKFGLSQNARSADGRAYGDTLVARADYLELEVKPSTARPAKMNHRESVEVELIFWRDIEKNDAVVRLRERLYAGGAVYAENLDMD